jgi:hypothetical protein
MTDDATRRNTNTTSHQGPLAGDDPSLRVFETPLIRLFDFGALWVVVTRHDMV